MEHALVISYTITYHLRILTFSIYRFVDLTVSYFVLYSLLYIANRRPATTETEVLSQTSPRGICGGRRDTRTGLTPSTKALHYAFFFLLLLFFFL